ncbi:MAG TPA: DUF4149 domain-containing protein [Pyrinomonadaceae bacterium]|nr:DUF4149 domain-containing protein [Pyrinomonadaceae bacterium]
MSAEVVENGAEVRAGANESVGRLAAVVRDVRLLLIALWLGGAVFFSGAVAPSAFAVLRARGVPYANEAAGSIVTRTLAVVNTSGFVIALLLLLSAFLFRRSVSRRALLAETIALALVGVAAGVGQWVIAARMVQLRAAMGRPIDDVAANDPLRLTFGAWHGYSVTALAVGVVAAAVALLLIARRDRIKAKRF